MVEFSRKILETARKKLLTNPGVPRVYRTDAVVLRSYDFGEADRILTLYTAHMGKLRAVAKGVRRTKSRMSGHLDLLTRSNLLLARGRQLDIITQAETLDSFAPLRGDLWRVSQARYVTELVDAFTPDGLPSYPLYSLTVATLGRLATQADVEITVRSFELQLLGITGYRPQLHRCVGCGSEIEPQANYFSARLGGVLCPSCSAADPAAPAISVEALKAMRNLQTNEPAMLRLGGLPEPVAREIEQRMQEYISYRLEARPRSLSFLERLRSESTAP